MSEHISIERMNDLVDGLLSSESAEPALKHMDSCGTCRDEYARLSELVADLRALPRDARPPEGLWAEIDRRIEGTVPAPAAGAGDVLAFPSGLAVRRRRFAFTVTQLAAASLVVSLVSGASVWVAMSRGGVASEPTAPPVAEGTRSAARVAATGAMAYDVALDELLAIVEGGRANLAPETLLALDRSLQAIDAAIEEIHLALESDPSSELLQSMLVNQQRSKLRVLRQVATRVEAQ